MNSYVAFIRGINVGGRRKIKMEDLRRIFSDAGCDRVRTYIQSGNVVFQIKQGNANKIAEKISLKILENYIKINAVKSRIKISIMIG